MNVAASRDEARRTERAEDHEPERARQNDERANPRIEAKMNHCHAH